MGVKPDAWIRRMATEHGMLEPFEPGLVRKVDGRPVVSFGTSRCGYDVRSADQFKVFTNVNSAIVDPKAFDERSFVDVKGPQCVVPPDSFALARTVGSFRVPREVLVICLGDAASRLRPRWPEGGVPRAKLDPFAIDGRYVIRAER